MYWSTTDSVNGVFFRVWTPAGSADIGVVRQDRCDVEGKVAA
jgi:hypothetical protein